MSASQGPETHSKRREHAPTLLLPSRRDTPRRDEPGVHHTAGLAHALSAFATSCRSIVGRAARRTTPARAVRYAGARPDRPAVQVAIPQATAGACHASGHDLDDDAPVRGGTETVLLVACDAETRACGRQALAPRGYRVLEAQSAGEALTLCAQHDGVIDLLLADDAAPGLCGPELAVRMLVRRPSMRVLYLTDAPADARTATSLGWGARDDRAGFVRKPFAADRLARCVRAVLDGPSWRCRVPD
jgi:CheY-like chemotaxis protein